MGYMTWLLSLSSVWVAAIGKGSLRVYKESVTAGRVCAKGMFYGGTGF